MAEFNCTYKKALTTYVPPETNYEEVYKERERETEGEQHQVLSQDINIEVVPRTQTSNTHIKEVTITKAGSSTSKAKKNGSVTQKVSSKKDSVKDKDKKNIQNSDTMIDWAAFSDSDSEIQEVETEKTNSTKKEKKKTWKLLWNKIKEKIWDSGTSLEEKIFECVKVISDWFTSFLMHYVLKLPFLSDIKQWITMTDF